MSGMTASTTNYLWSLQDVLGQGATASVYKARNKRSGELVAVKVFNVLSYIRPHDVQMREFDMLRRLNHSNIVKLFAVEELNSKQKVLVMEYCSGGSLLNLLEEPENAFGLPETEYLTVLQCIVQGMNHLRENGVVHRDIKPGNIMRQVGEDGKSVYKLTDFGAARELEDDEKFMSIYGTEEYLHPDMYERAVLRKPHQKSYGVSVDLWSIGVTLYHAATGRLPFTPFEGPRKNKPTMYKITTEKPMGAIAGVQRVEGGPIEWSYHLPHSCQLSQGLRVLLVPVLAGIMEADQERCWGFDQFFTATTDILQRQPVHLFSLQQAAAHCVYIHHYSTVSVFLEEVASQTGIGIQQQHLMYLGHELPLEGSMKVVNLPSTSSSRPLILLSYAPEAHTSLPFREPETPVIPSRFDVLADYSFSKAIVGVVNQYLTIVQLLHKHKELLLEGYYSYMLKLRDECREAMHSITKISIRLKSCLNTQHRIHKLGLYSPENHGSGESNQKLLQLHEHLPIYTAGIQEFQKRLNLLQIEQAKLAETLANDKSCQKMEMLLQKIMTIHQHYRKDRLTGKLAYNDEQIHKFEKIHLSSHIKRVKSLFREECVQRYKDLLASARTWSSLMQEMQTRLQDFTSFSSDLFGDLEMNEQQQTKAMDRILHTLQSKREEQPGVASRDKDQMVSRMHHLRGEMEILVRELQCNNSIIESLGAVNSAAALKLNPNRPSTL